MRTILILAVIMLLTWLAKVPFADKDTYPTSDNTLVTDIQPIDKTGARIAMLQEAKRSTRPLSLAITLDPQGRLTGKSPISFGLRIDCTMAAGCTVWDRTKDLAYHPDNVMISPGQQIGQQDGKLDTTGLELRAPAFGFTEQAMTWAEHLRVNGGVLRDHPLLFAAGILVWAVIWRLMSDYLSLAQRLRKATRKHFLAALLGTLVAGIVVASILLGTGIIFGTIIPSSMPLILTQFVAGASLAGPLWRIGKKRRASRAGKN